MRSSVRIRVESHIEPLRAPTAAVRWDLCLLVLLVLIGALVPPTRG